MYYRPLSFALLVISLLAYSGVTHRASAASDDRPVVATEYGLVAGLNADGVTSYKGIPYAAPPVGELRWQPPQPPAPWDGLRDAADFGCHCMQTPGIEQLSAKASEDCLYLNVWQPAGTSADADLPVLVWIHGGGYVNGGADSPIYDGSAFARQGIVVASFNYRLGRLGFFAHPALLAANEGPVGNFGCMDQLAALRWVQDNIAAFGGDPQRVTVAGESAGGASVVSLLCNPQARGLFQQAVIMSGGGRHALAALPLQPSAEQPLAASVLDAEFAAGLGVAGDGPEALAALRALSAEALVGDVNLPNLLAATAAGLPVPGTPLDDGELALLLPGELFEAGTMQAVPLLVGTTALDLPVHFPPLPDPYAYFGDEAEAARIAYNPDGSKLPQEVMLSIGADMTMHEPARLLARAMSTAGRPAWLYRFGYVAEEQRAELPGQVHAGELPFMFDTLEAVYGSAVADGDRQTAASFHGYIANFVLSGDPNGAGFPDWPCFDPQRYELLHFPPQGGPEFTADPRPGVALVERAARRHSPAAQSQQHELTGTGWRFVRFASGDGSVSEPGDRLYTVEFREDGRAALRFDCNHGSGSWTSAAPGQLEFGPAALTLMLCPPGSLDSLFTRQWGYIRSYLLRDGRLYLSLAADGGIFEFEPLADNPSSGAGGMQ